MISGAWWHTHYCKWGEGQGSTSVSEKDTTGHIPHGPVGPVAIHVAPRTAHAVSFRKCGTAHAVGRWLCRLLKQSFIINHTMCIMKHYNELAWSTTTIQHNDLDNVITMLIQFYYKLITMILQCYYNSITMLSMISQSYHNPITVLLQCF